MKINEVLSESFDQFRIIVEQCSQFIEESSNSHLMRNLPCAYDNVHRVKVRKKHANGVDLSFNAAFDEMHPHLRQRCVFTYGSVSESATQLEPFYVFPIDGFKFMYCTEVTDSSSTYQQAFQQITETFGDVEGNELFADMLKFTYIHEDLSAGIKSGAEIVLYNIPLYYAVRATPENSTMLTELNII